MKLCMSADTGFFYAILGLVMGAEELADSPVGDRSSVWCECVGTTTESVCACETSP